MSGNSEKVFKSERHFIHEGRKTVKWRKPSVDLILLIELLIIWPNLHNLFCSSCTINYSSSPFCSNRKLCNKCSNATFNSHSKLNFTHVLPNISYYFTVFMLFYKFFQASPAKTYSNCESLIVAQTCHMFAGTGAQLKGLSAPEGKMCAGRRWIAKRK